MKKNLLLLTTMLSLFPTDPVSAASKASRNTDIGKYDATERIVKKEKLTLIGKQHETVIEKNPCGETILERRVVLFFDTDGDTNTTEFVAAKYCPCLRTEAKVFDAKIGDTKKSQEWKDFLSHQDEDRCRPFRMAGASYIVPKFNHRMMWDRVKD